MLYEDRVFIILYKTVCLCFALLQCCCASSQCSSSKSPLCRFYSRSASFSDSLITPKKAHPTGIYAQCYVKPKIVLKSDLPLSLSPSIIDRKMYFSSISSSYKTNILAAGSWLQTRTLQFLAVAL